MSHDPLDAIVAAVAEQLRPSWDAMLPLKEYKRPNLGSAWVVIEDPETGRVLLGKRAKAANNAGQWNLFGGGIETGESAIQTALRELWEEGGIKASPEQVTKLAGTPHNITIFVLAMTASQVTKALRLNPKEVSKVRWCDPDKLPANLHKSALGLVHAGHSSVGPTDDLDSAGAAMRRAMDVVEGKKGPSQPSR